MTTTSDVSDPDVPRDAAHWAQPVARLTVSDVPRGAFKMNVDGHEIIGPLQGFGQLWQKTYRVRLPGVNLTPAEVMHIWKAEFPQFQPRESRFYPPMTGVQPGQLMFIDLDLPVGPGLPSVVPMSSGVMILYADDEMFTVMTPAGFPVSGWNTFSVYEEDGCLVAQVQSMDRATDPIYELGSIFMGGARRQEENWIHVLTALARRFGVQGQVDMHTSCLDRRWQWSQAKNIWHNASLRTVIYKLATPARWASRLLRQRDG